jgi:hypothetical protein
VWIHTGGKKKLRWDRWRQRRRLRSLARCYIEGPCALGFRGGRRSLCFFDSPSVERISAVRQSCRRCQVGPTFTRANDGFPQFGPRPKIVTPMSVSWSHDTDFCSLTQVRRPIITQYSLGVGSYLSLRNTHQLYSSFLLSQPMSTSSKHLLPPPTVRVTN